MNCRRTTREVTGSADSRHSIFRMQNFLFFSELKIGKNTILCIVIFGIKKLPTLTVAPAKNDNGQ